MKIQILAVTSFYQYRVAVMSSSEKRVLFEMRLKIQGPS